MVKDTIYLINDVISEGKNVLIEGANTIMLDFDRGELECCRMLLEHRMIA